MIMTPPDECERLKRKERRLWDRGLALVLFAMYGLGALSASLRVIIFQDYLGKEGYIEHLQRGWIDLSGWVWLEIVALIVSVVTAFWLGLFTLRWQDKMLEDDLG